MSAKLMVAILIVLLLLAGGKAMADGPILDFTGGSAGFAVPPLTGGWEFTVTSPITISALGIWDEGANGLAATHQLGLWTSGGTLLTSAIITNADSTPVASTSSAGDWRFTSVTSLTLAPGDYVVGATYGSFDPDFIRLATDNPSTIAGVTFDMRKELIGAGLIFPSSKRSGIAQRRVWPQPLRWVASCFRSRTRHYAPSWIWVDWTFRIWEKEVLKEVIHIRFMEGKGRVLQTLPFLFISFGNRQSSESSQTVDL